MRKFLLMFAVIALFTACEESGDPMNPDEGYKYLSSLNVSDAKMIYQKSSNTRAGGGDDSYYKLDLNGNESKLVIKGEDGQDYNIKIDKIFKLSDNLLLVNPRTQDIFDLINKQNPDGVQMGTFGDNMDYLSLVDIKTEKIYKWAKDIWVNLYPEYRGGGFETTSDSQGNIYFASCYDLKFPTYDQIYKLNPVDFTVQKLLPDGEHCNGFEVTEDGFVVFWDDFNIKLNCMVKCPDGSIHPVRDTNVFVLSGNLYSVRDNKIIHHQTSGNSIKEEEICDIPDELTYYGEMQFTTNYVRNTTLINGQYEFDGETCIKILDNPLYIGDIRTSKAWYTTYDLMTFSKISMADYQTSEFEVSDYRIQTISASSTSPNITFTGFRYSDGASVIGTIDENDRITTTDVENGENIINLIPLN